MDEWKTGNNSVETIAIIGMAGRFPGAKNIDEFWQNLSNGVESISFFSDEELLASGIDPALLNNSNYVRARGVLSDIEMFDASFFNFTPHEAEVTDPQHRLFLEYAWEALESAGYNSETYDGRIGVYAGAGLNAYLLQNLSSNRQLSGAAEVYQLQIGNDKDFVPTRVSFKLNLTGPSVNVNTACSTSLVAVQMACQSLLNYQCDMVLAGGVSVRVPQKAGYLYEEGMILSPDGHCKAFDAQAQGTVIGSGVGIVVLKRLEDALADGDCIHATIKGSAINNDGSLKIGYTAPSIDGQAAVILEAQALAGIEAETVTYIEAHGTGTALGDPIEIAALKQAFSPHTQKKGFCAIGSVKTNVGHLDAASGVTALIKTVLALKHQKIPPSLHFQQPNPEIDFDNSPFYVNTKLEEWKTNGIPRRAGVSSFGFGGTNAHVVLEEAPSRQPSGQSRPWQLLLLSAKTSSALETATANLAAHWQRHPELKLADLAYTLQVGRRAFDYRRFVLSREGEEVGKILENQEPQRVFTNYQPPGHRPVVFLFSGQGAQYVQMAAELYEVEQIFREQVDLCSLMLKPLLGVELRELLFPGSEERAKASEQLRQTAITQPAMFVIEYALAQLWMAWGVRPAAMVGHSIGEYVAATLAGVFSLADALALVAARGQLMQQLPQGSMVAVSLGEGELQPRLGKELSLAAINGPSSCVVSGATEAIELLEKQLAGEGVACRRLHTSHAFHSQMMAPMMELFAQRVKQIRLKPPQIPYLSNLTGTWIKAEEATSASYWASHLRGTVRFADNLQHLFKQASQILLEVGPGRTLSKLARTHPQKKPEQVVLTSLRHPQESGSDEAFLLKTLGQLWLLGVQLDWSAFSQNEQRHRIPLPTYPFERQRYWVEPEKLSPSREQVRILPTVQQLWESLVEAGQRQASAGISEFDEQVCLENKKWLERLCLAYMNLALRGLGAFINSDDNYSFEELFEQCQIIPRYRQLLSRWLQDLVEQGHLQQDGERFTNLLPLSKDSVDALLEEVRVRWTDTPQEVDLVQICGENLVPVLIGEQEPLELFNALIYEKITESSEIEIPWIEYHTAIMRSSLEEVVKLLPPSVNLRILEIGAGTGTTTSALLPVLPSKQTNYTFTDLGGGFLTQAKQKFSDYPFFEYRLLDIEKSPQEQGYSSHSFDVVVASNVLHVTRNMGETLDRVRSLLAPGGFLLLWEFTQPQLDFDLTWGLLMNPLEDEERSQGNPFLSKEKWLEALRAHGFREMETFSETNAFGQHIIVAQASTSASSLAPAAFTTTFEHEQKGAERTPLVSLGKNPNMAEWFYIPSWKRSVLQKSSQSRVETTQLGCWLVFVDEWGLGSKIVKQLEAEGKKAIAVRIGEQFSSESESPTNGASQRLYTINPQHGDDYDALLKELRALGLTPTKIAHLWSVTPHPESGLEGIDKAQERGLYSLLFLVQALGKQNLTHELEISVVSNSMQAVTGEEMVVAEKATLLGAVKVIPREYPNISCRSIDVVLPSGGSWQEEKLVDQLLAELAAQISDEVVAYRSVHRWVQDFEPARLEGQFQETPRLREEGVYLITGGLGFLGLNLLATHLAKTVRAKLILIGRSAFPSRDEWSEWLLAHDRNDDVSRKIRKVQELEQLGAEVLVISADVANLEQMQEAIAQAQERFGQIDGVIHTAGVLGDSAIARKTIKQVESVLAPKVKGTLVLDTIFKDVDLDFLVLCSSGSSIMPLPGQIAYAGANNFLDAFAHHKTSRDGRFTVSINWYGWKESGMGVEGTKHIPKIFSARTKSVAHPFFEQCLVEDSKQEIYISNLSASKHWVLDEHRVMGKATLPGTAYLELVRAACENNTQNGTLEIRDITFLTPLTVEEDEEKEIRTLLKKQGDSFEFLIMSRSHSESEQWIEHARGEIACIEARQPKKYEIDEIAAQCNQEEIIITERERQTRSEFLKFGARWNNLKQVKIGTNQGLALLELPAAYTDDLNSYKLHPALLDSATGFLAGKFLDEGTYLPFVYKRLRIVGSLPAKVYSYIRVVENNQSEEGSVSFNITILDERGTELVEIEEYTLRKVNLGKADTATPKQSAPQREKTLAVKESENFSLSISTPGILDTLKFQPTARQQPGLGEVEIEVAVTGLNFMEVLIGMGLLPVPTDSAFEFGFECAGKIVALGKGVEDFQLGDEVIALGSSCFSRFITTPAKFVAPKPEHLSLEEATTIPIAFSTAYYSLIKVGRLSQGESVLIHSAAGGVGMAAVQIAQWVGAEIFATAGTPEKREFLQSKGIKHVMNSRTLDFADEVMRRTDGRGVDVVLNSLGGEFLSKSLSVLAPYGRFLEIGQRDILNNSKLDLRPFEKNLTFSAIHPNIERFNHISLTREVVKVFKEGNFFPLPLRVFPITEVADAFEYMAQGKHIGKIVVSQQDPEALRKLMVSEEIVTPEAKEKMTFPLSSPSVSSTPSPVNFQKETVPTNQLPSDSFREDWLSTSETIEVFSRILGSTMPQVLICPSDLFTWREHHQTYSQPNLLSSFEKANLSQTIQPTHSRPQLNNEYIAPKNEIEQQIAKVWQEVLGIKEVGIHDNFFELGGDSLLIVQVRSKLQKTLNKEFSIAEAFEYPTISALAEYLSGEQVEELAFQQVNERANRLQEAMEEEAQLIEKRRKARE
ncbi:MAG: SDR family oxidoreductase [Oscillatoria sp. PMC 1051.18]|nr:SDR family oxidoreductase [Oscillatoria sp. PMC 1050.18]MEC5028406.1 SDR family oxidoreductase [Oscillatoria sp. PMC 1051.18]